MDLGMRVEIERRPSRISIIEKSNTWLLEILAQYILVVLLEAYQFIIQFQYIVLGQECDVFEFGMNLQLLHVGTCSMNDWCMVIRNPGKMYCWNDQSHGICDQDFGTKMLVL